MTWVLILSPAGTGWPAVIGGYPSCEEATAAGRVATKAAITDELNGRDWFELFDLMSAEGRDYAYRPWVAFTVIPGAAR